MDGRELMEVALAAARAAAAVHRAYLGRVAVDQWSEKGTADFVTHVDREAERAVVELVHARFPDHGFLAEEGTLPDAAEQVGASADADWVWIVDPLDGTTNFLHGYPMYAASVAVTYRGGLRAGAVVATATNEEWCAYLGGGAFKDGRSIRVSEIADLRRGLIGTGFPFKAIDRLPEYLAQFDRVLRNSSGVRRAGSAAIDLCHVATGYFDGFWELSLLPWDVAAGTLIVREAGGLVTRFNGDPDVLGPGPGEIVAGNPAIHARLIELLGNGG